MIQNNIIAFGGQKNYDLTESFNPKELNYDGHAFEYLMNVLKFRQPKAIELMNKSVHCHFLHNYLVQNDKSAFNLIKVYCSEEIELAIFKEQIQNMTHEEKIEKIVVKIIFNSTDHVQGHPGRVHGGLQATLFDNLFGYVAVIANDLHEAATGYLNISYKKPTKTNQDYMMSGSIEKIEGRKVFMKAIVTDIDGVIHTEARCVFIKVNWGQSTKNQDNLKAKL